MIDNAMNDFEIAKDYITSAYYHPAYLSDYYTIFNLYKNSKFSEISSFFEQLKKRDEKRAEYLVFKNFKKSEFKEGIKISNLLDNHEEKCINNLVDDIFENYINLSRNLPTFCFMILNQKELHKRYIVKNEELINKALLKGEGLVISSHHWGGFQYALLYLISKNLPITFLVSDDIAEWLCAFIDEEYFHNIKILGISSGILNSNISNEKTIYESIKDLQNGRIVFTLSDHSVALNRPNNVVDFLGNNVYLPELVAAIAIKSKSPIIHLHSMLSATEKKVYLEFNNIIETKSAKKTDITRISRESFKYMESILRKNHKEWTYADWYYKYMVKK